MLDNGRRCLISVRQHSLPCLLQIIFRPQRYTPIRSPLLVRVREPTDRKSESPPFGLLHHSKSKFIFDEPLLEEYLRLSVSFNYNLFFFVSRADT